jgi:molybdopterin-guanine dinucleotide biosynthesis protein A
LEAIILAGGDAWQLKPNTWVPKPKPKTNNETLIPHQINRLKRRGISRIILATDSPSITDNPSDGSIVWRKTEVILWVVCGLELWLVS